MHGIRLAAAAVATICATLAAPAAQASTATLIGESTISGSLTADYTASGIGLDLTLDWDIGTPAGRAHHVLHATGDLAATVTLSVFGNTFPFDVLGPAGLPSSFDETADLGVFAFGPLLSIPEVGTALGLLTAGLASGSGSGSDFFDVGFNELVEAGGSYSFAAGSTLTSGSVSASAFVNETSGGEIAAAIDELLSDLLGITLPNGVGVADVTPVVFSVEGSATLKSYAVPAIPLPAGAALLPVGLGALVVLRRRRRA